MRLLIFTQAVDTEDSVLGFFHEWIKRLAVSFESVEVICLKEGKHDLPQNVTVHSLGKEKGNNRIQYIVNFFKYIFHLRNSYDKVFVHMNQEYILLGGIFWKFWGKDIFFWRNHVYGNIFTRIACSFAKKIFYTSNESFTARYKKAHKMPVGIDTEKYQGGITRDENQFLVISRITPNKKIDFIVRGFMDSFHSSRAFGLTIYGGPIPKTKKYDMEIRELVHDSDNVHMMGEVTHDKTPTLYQESAFFINMTGPGSFDKTLIEALAGGAILITNNPAVKEVVAPEFFIEGDNMEMFKNALLTAGTFGIDRREDIRRKGRKYVEREHSLTSNRNKIVKCIQG